MSADEPAVGVFTRASAHYGKVGPDLFGHFASRICSLVELAPGWSVLDVACGTGVVLVEATLDS